MQTAYPRKRLTETALLYCVSTSISATVIQSCRLHIWWKVNGNSFNLLCQYHYLRNAYPQLQTRYTSGRSSEAALLYCVSTSISGTLLHSGRLHILVEGHRKQLYSTVSVPLSQNACQQLQTAYIGGRSTETPLLYGVKTSIWGTLIHCCRLHILVEVQQKHFTLLSQYFYLRNGYPQLQTAYTGGRSTETPLL